MSTYRTPPNILWICTDQQRGDTIHALGNPYIRTPNLDRLVKEGTSFTRAYCQSPICTPSRASFLTGKYASTVRCCRNGNDHWEEAAPLVTKLMKDEGYTCGLAGKLHLSSTSGRVEPRPQDDGYSLFEWSHSARDLWPEGHAYADWVRSQGENLGELRERLGYIPSHLHQTKWCADRAIDFIRKRKEKKGPWLFSVNMWDPHKPFDPPPDYLERYHGKELPDPAFRESDLEAQARLSGADFQTKPTPPEDLNARDVIARYYAMIEQIDDHVGRMLDALEETGQRKNTLVIFMSDHGEMLGDHGLLLKGCRFYDGLTRVPLVFSQPGTVKEDHVCSGLTELTDLAPTFLDLLGRTPEPGMAGHSLLPVLLEGKKTVRDSVRSEYYQALNPSLLERESDRECYATMYRDNRYKLVVYHGLPVGELFDMESDPDEFDNLWDNPDYREIRNDMILRSFDRTVRAFDLGPPQTGDY